MSLLGDEEHVYGGRIDLVEVWQRRHARVRRVDAAVELAASQGEDHSSAAVMANRKQVVFAREGGRNDG
jgi:hypothetical protein